MRKIITLLLLISTTFLFAQKEFLATYNYSQVSFSDGSKDPWKEMRTEFIFNYDGNTQKVVMKVANKFIDLYQVGPTVKGRTNDDKPYQVMKLLDNDDSVYIIQYFDNQELYGTRLIINDKMIHLLN